VPTFVDSVARQCRKSYCRRSLPADFVPPLQSFRDKALERFFATGAGALSVQNTRRIAKFCRVAAR